MNLLLINGSPKGKRSNTYRLSTTFAEGIRETKDVEYEELDVTALKLEHCLGCFSCWNKTAGRCIIKDDMALVIEKMLWADVIIWSFPLYYFNVPSKLKVLIDRQLPMLLPFMVSDAQSGGHPQRYDVSNKRHVLISTCGFYTAKGNYDSVTSMFDRFITDKNYETVFCGQGELFSIAEVNSRTAEYLSTVKSAGKEYAKGKIEAKTREKLDELLYPKEQFEAMADLNWGIDKSGEKIDGHLRFTKQMAATYNKNSYKKDIVLQMDYTDVKKSYQIVLTRDKAEVLTENFMPYTTKISTPLSVWQDIAKGKISGSAAMMKGLYKVKGKMGILMRWNKYFG